MTFTWWVYAIQTLIVWFAFMYTVILPVEVEWLTKSSPPSMNLTGSNTSVLSNLNLMLKFCPDCLYPGQALKWYMPATGAVNLPVEALKWPPILWSGALVLVLHSVIGDAAPLPSPPVSLLARNEGWFGFVTYPSFVFYLIAVVTLTTGSVFLMRLGEN